MASLAGISGLGIPRLSANMDPADVKAIQNWAYQLTEQLQYMFTNLDSTNFSADMQQTVSGMSAAAASREASSRARKK